MLKKTTAKIEILDERWIIAERCSVDFNGFRAEEMEKKWNAIKDERFFSYHSLFEENKIKIENLQKKVIDIHKQVKTSNPFFRFCYNNAEKEMLSEADKLSNEANELEEENKEIEDKLFFGACDCRIEIEELLKQNGFVLTSTSSRGDKYITKIEVWTLEE